LRHFLFLRCNDLRSELSVGGVLAMLQFDLRHLDAASWCAIIPLSNATLASGSRMPGPIAWCMRSRLAW
jgi:hypothetical protein